MSVSFYICILISMNLNKQSNNMKKTLLKVCFLLLGVMVLASCTDNIYDRPHIEDRTKAYMKMFGEIDPKQDWNMAERKSIIVDAAGSSNVKIYARSRAAYVQVADYQNVSGTQELGFDAARDVDDFVVIGGGTVKLAKNGETVSLDAPASRVLMNSGGLDANGQNPYVEQLSSYKIFTIDEIYPFLQYVPEGKDSRTNPSFHSDFLAVSTADREVTIYPVYWNAGFYHEFGIYTYRADGTKDERVVWRNKEAGATTVEANFKTFTENEAGVKVEGETGFTNPSTYWTGSTSKKECINDANTYVKAVRSKGFKVKLPAGQTYGFFIKAYNTSMSTYKSGTYTSSNYDAAELVHTWYSEARHNYDKQGHASFFETLVEKNGQKVYQTFLGFEDTVVHAQGNDRNYPGYTKENGDSIYNCSINADGKYTSGGWKGDRDYNDLMFIIDPAPVVIDHTEQEWIIAAEDLGQEDDFYFNDLVVSVKNIAGKDSAQITALAAGGTLPLYFYKNDTLIGGGEYHEVFFDRFASEKSGLYPMINTYAYNTPGKTIKICVGPNFSLTTFRGSYMGGFNIVMHEESSTDGKGQVIITPPHEGEAPQMICVPAGWKWPKERVLINNPYPLFGEWGKDYTNAKWAVEENIAEEFKSELIVRKE